MFPPGPARSMKFSNLSARRGPVHDIRNEAHGTRALCGPGPVNLKHRPIGYKILKDARWRSLLFVSSVVRGSYTVYYIPVGSRFMFEFYSTPHTMGRGPGRPATTRRPSHGHGRRGHRSSKSTPHILGSGPGRPYKTYFKK